MDIAIIVFTILGIIVAIVVDGYVESTLFIQKYSNNNYKSECHEKLNKRKYKRILIQRTKGENKNGK